MKLIYKAQGLIERDALAEQLRYNGIETLTPPRDVSRKVTPNTLDLSTGVGYAIDFDGFAIYVAEENVERAQQIIKEAFERTRLTIAEDEDVTGDDTTDKTTDNTTNTKAKPAAKDPWKNFYMSAVASLMFPLVFHVAAIYAFINATQKRAQPNKFYLAISIILLSVSAFEGYSIVMAIIERITLS